MDGVGAHEVIIETPEHFQTLADAPEKRVEDLFWAYRDRVLDLRRDVRLRYLLLCKNHGEAAGAVLEHTHSQLHRSAGSAEAGAGGTRWRTKHFEYKERCVYCDILAQEGESAVPSDPRERHFAVFLRTPRDSHSRRGSSRRRTTPMRKICRTPKSMILLRYCKRCCGGWTRRSNATVQHGAPLRPDSGSGPCRITIGTSR